MIMRKTSSLFGLILLFSFLLSCASGEKTADTTSAQKQQHDNGTTDTQLRRATVTLTTEDVTAEEEGEVEINKDPKRDRDHEKKKLRQQRRLSDHYYESDDSDDGQEAYTLAVRGTMQLEMFGSDGSDNDRRQLRLRGQGKEGERRLDGHLIDEITNADINAWLDATEDFYFDSMFNFRVTRGRVLNFQMGYLDSEWSTETQCFLVTFRAVIRARGGSGLRVRQVARAMAQADYVTYITDYLWEEDDGNTPWFETQRVEYDGRPVIKGFDF